MVEPKHGSEGYMEAAAVTAVTSHGYESVPDRVVTEVEDAVVRKHNLDPENVEVSTSDGNVTVTVKGSPTLPTVEAVGDTVKTLVKTRTSAEVTDVAVQKG